QKLRLPRMEQIRKSLQKGQVDHKRRECPALRYLLPREQQQDVLDRELPPHYGCRPNNLASFEAYHVILTIGIHRHPMPLTHEFEASLALQRSSQLPAALSLGSRLQRTYRATKASCRIQRMLRMHH